LAIHQKSVAVFVVFKWVGLIVGGGGGGGEEEEEGGGATSYVSLSSYH